MDVLDTLTTQALSLLTSTRRDARTPAVRLARSLHPTPPLYPGGVRSRLDDVPHVLPALARHAQAGDRHALLLAAVFMRDQLRATAARVVAADIDDALSETLAATFDLLRAAAEPEVLTPRLVAAHTAKRLHARFSGQNATLPCDPHATVFDQPATSQPDDAARPTEQLLADARAQRVITALEHLTLTELYLSTGTASPATAAQALCATSSAIERRAQRAIRKLARYVTATGPRAVAA